MTHTSKHIEMLGFDPEKVKENCDFLSFVENLEFSEEDYVEPFKLEPCRRVRSGLLKKAYREKWLGPLELWLRLGIHRSGIARIDQILEVEMDVSERTKRRYLEKCIDLGLITTDGMTYWILGTHTVQKKFKIKGASVRWWPHMPLKEFTYAAVCMIVLNYFSFLPALRCAGAIKDTGGVSHSIMQRHLGISKGQSSKMRRRCEKAGLIAFERRWVLTDIEPRTLDELRSLKYAHPSLIQNEGRVYREVTSEADPRRILLSVPKYKKRKS